MATQSIIRALPHASTSATAHRQTGNVASSLRSFAFSVFAKTQESIESFMNEATDRLNSEKFYQDHIIAIYIGHYVEMALVVGLATLGIKLFTR